MRGTLFFDGGCGMCTRARNRLVRLDRTGELRTEPYQQAGTAHLLGVSADRLPDSVWWLGDDGRVFAAAEAVNAALSSALGTTLPLRFYRLPGVRQVQERVYRWVAGHRYRFPGATPFCEAQPAACQ